MKRVLIVLVLSCLPATVYAAPVCGPKGCTLKNRPAVKWAVKATPVRNALRNLARHVAGK